MQKNINCAWLLNIICDANNSFMVDASLIEYKLFLHLMAQIQV